MIDVERHKARCAALTEAQKLMTGAALVGRFLGALVALLPWWLSHAPWWAIPIFVLVIGWASGKIYCEYVARVLWRKLKVEYPELGS